MKTVITLYYTMKRSHLFCFLQRVKLWTTWYTLGSALYGCRYYPILLLFARECFIFDVVPI